MEHAKVSAINFVFLQNYNTIFFSYYYRPRTKYGGKVIFSICLSVHGGGGGVLPLLLVTGPFQGGGVPQSGPWGGDLYFFLSTLLKKCNVITCGGDHQPITFQGHMG